MTYPGDDDYVNIQPEGDEDYALYDREWFDESEHEIGYFDYQNHALWPEIQAGGWSQVPNTIYLQKGRVIDHAGVVGGRYYQSPHVQTQEGIAQEIAQIIQPHQLQYDSNDLIVSATWMHFVGDETVQQGYDVQPRRSKYYATLGLALDEARRRERGGGYADYVREDY